DAGIVIEGVVFDSDRRILDIGADRGKRDRGALFRAVGVVEDDVARAVVDLRRLRDFAVLKIVDRRDRDERSPKDHAAEEEERERYDGEHEEFEPLRDGQALPKAAAPAPRGGLRRAPV